MYIYVSPSANLQRSANVQRKLTYIAYEETTTRSSPCLLTIPSGVYFIQAKYHRELKSKMQEGRPPLLSFDVTLENIRPRSLMKSPLVKLEAHTIE